MTDFTATHAQALAAAEGIARCTGSVSANYTIETPEGSVSAVWYADSIGGWQQRAADNDIALVPSDFKRIDGELTLDGMTPDEWFDAMLGA